MGSRATLLWSFVRTWRLFFPSQVLTETINLSSRLRRAVKLCGLGRNLFCWLFFMNSYWVVSEESSQKTLCGQCEQSAKPGLGQTDRPQHHGQNTAVAIAPRRKPSLLENIETNISSLHPHEYRAHNVLLKSVLVHPLC